MTYLALLHRLPGASPALLELLESLPGPVQPPIRSEIFGPQRFAQHGRSLAQTHQAARSTLRAATFFPRLRSNIRTLRQAHRYIGTQAATGYDISPAAEWLLDNFHLIEAQLQEIHEGLPRSYFRALPLLQDEPLAGLPRIYGVAWAFVAHTDSAFDENLLLHFLSAYQEARELTLSEMWALPTTLRVVLVENLRRLAERVATNKAAREIANLCCDHLDQLGVSDMSSLLEWLTRRGVNRVFLAQMAQRLQDVGQASQAGRFADIQTWLRHALPDLAGLQAQQNADQAADNLSVSNAVKSLRAIGNADWADLVAQTSTLMQRMLTSSDFAAEHPHTRDVSLHAIEQLARRNGRSEITVANRLLTLMHPTGSNATAANPAGYWLLGPGRPELLAALGLREPLADFVRRAGRKLALPAYLGTLVVGTFALVAWLLLRHSGVAAGSTTPHGWALAGVLLLIFPASEAVVAVINRVISESVPPLHLPRLAFASGIPQAHRVLVTIPALLTDNTSSERLVHRLLLHYLANPESQAQFALLTDWIDADTEQLGSDEATLQSVQMAIRRLNQLHAREGAPRFIVLHRPRVFSETEQKWIGWERKRGKLEQLVEALATGAGTDFLDLGAESQLATDTPYIVTLDSDTQLPPGRLRALVSVAAHPSNRPQLDPTGRFVERGYGILQPRVVTPLPAPKDFTLFHWLFAGQCGIDPYSAASSEIYQDLFGEGTFTGKGLLHVAALHAVLSQRLPEGQVLSHDLLEGSIARCAAVSDISVIEDAPFHADVAAARVHRWTRGDWQLLPFLLQPRRYSLRAINMWKMFDNLRRSLVPPVSMLLLLVTLDGGLVSPLTAVMLVLAAFSAGPLMGAVAGFSPSRDDIAKRHFYLQASKNLARVLWGGLWLVAQLLPQSLRAMDAIARALYRTEISHRHLLQWTTAAAVQASVTSGLRSMLARHRSEPLMALALLVGALTLETPHPWLAGALCTVWGASPLWAWWVSRPHAKRDEPAISGTDRVKLLGIARDSWQLFERCVTAEDSHLPPDNLQTLPHEMLAHRTSPTNIGLYLLSAACARQFGWISTPQLLERLEATAATLETLERYKGHFFNWYDTQTRAPLAPLYVSTVDSGNLSAHLLATAQACLELAGATSGASVNQVTVERLQAMAARLEHLAWQADFSFLYHTKRNLFHIGYRWTDQQVDTGFYDLLASESRTTSLLAIAKGDVPAAHWAALGRPFYAMGSRAGLRSWSGSMFEYLMPGLTLEEPHGSVLNEACHVALAEQMAFARERSVPWGISESAYAGRDHTLAYQYAPQGVPRLALRRTPPDQLVVAPYATALAAQLAAREACLNFAALQALGARGLYGFLEALDFSPAQRSGTDAFTPVSTFMAHHQGMSIVALANVLLDGPAQRWGMANAHMQAVTSLLHERPPREVPLLNEPPQGRTLQALQHRAPGLLREVVPGATALEPTHVLSNGHYSVALRANGAGWSRWGATGITRWRDDALRDSFGSFFYLRQSGQPVPASITQHPAPDPAAHYLSTYHADRVCFDATWPGLQAHTTVWVSPEDDIEFRRVELRNLGNHPLDIELVSAFEITLADPRADEAHPAFSNLFVRAEWLARHRALVFWRTPRLSTEQGLHATHFLASSDTPAESIEVQTNRQRWLGRNRDVSQPLGLLEPVPDGGSDAPVTLDTGLDPVCVLSVRLRIAPQSSAKLVFATGAALDRGTLMAVIDKYCQPSHVDRSSLMSATLAGIRLRGLRISADNFAATQTLTTALVMSLTRPQTSVVRLDGTPPIACQRQLLWRFGLSGDRPLILVSAGVIQGLGLLRSLAQALRLWAWCGIPCDMVVVNAEPASYQMELHRELVALRDRHLAGNEAKGTAATTGLHVLHADELSVQELDTLQRLARARFNADGRPLQHHVQEWSDSHETAFWARNETSTVPLPVNSGSTGIRHAVPAPRGDFDTASGEFHFDTSARLRPARPWVNVLANPDFGTQISEAGGGYTWAVNSRMNQITAWSNDPVADPPSEWFLLQDRRTLGVWSLAPGACGDGHVTYRVTHGQGHTEITHWHDELEVRATWCVDAQTSVKQVRVQLLNRGHRALHLRVVGVAEWMMGARREDRATVQTSLYRQRVAPADQKLTALMCTQHDHSGGFGDGTAFLGLAGAANEEADWTCDRRECFDARGRRVLPDHFGQRSGDGLDPCAALSVSLVLKGGDATERVFLLGYAASPSAARELAVLATTTPPAQRSGLVRKHWDALLGTSEVKTPDPLFDVLVNRWLLYQTVSCRLWAKAGFYQAGGATGFRDQLQDTLALAWAAPAMLRAQILLCASRQFPQGDVQHWWHAPGGAGVRTHFSDDLLWLAHACLHYLQATSDTTVLDEVVPFIDGIPIPEGAEDAYYLPDVSPLAATVYEHAARAIDRSLQVGEHGLPLMGSGDWNDGMNRVGHEGRGESVWLGWFLCQLVAGFAPLAHQRGDLDRALRWGSAAQGWKAALNGPAWDGQWFVRAFFDDGQPLGAQANPEARIDLIAQAWAVLSGATTAERGQQAMAAADSHLADPQDGLLRLLDPPLVHAQPSAGYIQAYPPGIRENGGQYSHAAVWALMAQAQVAVTRTPAGQATDGDAAWRTFTWLSPAHRAAHPTQGLVYGIEPYVLAGDVYTQAPYTGRGGWSWYTGAAAWLHRAALESIFGLNQRADELCFMPCLPTHWPRAELTLRRDGTTMHFTLMRCEAAEALTAMAADGASLLRHGQWLAWTGLEAHSCFVIPLLGSMAGSTGRDTVLHGHGTGTDSHESPAFLK